MVLWYKTYHSRILDRFLDCFVRFVVFGSIACSNETSNGILAHHSLLFALGDIQYQKEKPLRTKMYTSTVNRNSKQYTETVYIKHGIKDQTFSKVSKDIQMKWLLFQTGIVWAANIKRLVEEVIIVL